MRPEILFPLFADIKTLPGVGKMTAAHLKRLVGSRLIDLYWHSPFRLQQRIGANTIVQAPLEQLVTLNITVDRHFPPQGRGARRPYRVLCHDATSSLDLVFFHGDQKYLEKKLPPGEPCVVSGKITLYKGDRTITHPDHVGPPQTYAHWVGAEPIYPLTYALTSSMVRRFIQQALKDCPSLPEWIEEDQKHQEAWPSWKEALLCLHHPRTEEDLHPLAPHRRRLAYDEFLASQLALRLIRKHQERPRETPLVYTLEKRQKVLDSLGFSLTEDQNRALAEIDQDMRSSQRMTRLLQGDVGSGKTIVAFFALLNSIQGGGQSAFMVPTEILARQHVATLTPWAEKAGITIACLTGHDSGASRKDILKKLHQGAIDLLIGTHTLIQEEVLFKNLRGVVIDEQHRFGVEQRLRLVEKGKDTDLLTLSATPIPRTLMMTVQGDLKVSLLQKKPEGRQNIQTCLIDMERLAEIIDRLKSVLKKGEKIYWVCPLIEESEDSDLAAAQERYAFLVEALPSTKVGLLHGRLTAREKEATLQHFLDGDLALLVSTTVIEVGIHVPDATIMVIEHAERFGLAQLHQLRGRVGRSDRLSTCLLLYKRPLSEGGFARLKKMRETNDGFLLAEEDLKLRGGGDLLSSKQSGLPALKLGDYFLHQDLLSKAHQEAETILEQDPCLLTERGKNLRTLLYLFEQDQMIFYLRGG